MLACVFCMCAYSRSIDASVESHEEGESFEEYQEGDRGQADQGKPLHLLMSFVLLFYNMHILPIYASACLSNVLSIQGLASPSWPLYIYSYMENPSLIPITHSRDV